MAAAVIVLVRMVIERRRDNRRFMAVVLVTMRLIARNRAVRMMVMVVLVVIMSAATAVMVVMGMFMPVMIVMCVARLEIGSAFRVERRLDRAHLAAETFDHGVDHVVTADAQAPARDLHRQVTVAEVPCEAQQVLGILGADFAEGFGGAHDLDDAAICQLHGVARTQRDGLGQIKQEGKPAHSFHGDAAAMAIIIIEHHGIGGGAVPVTLGDHFGCAQHGVFLYVDLGRC